MIIGHTRPNNFGWLGGGTGVPAADGAKLTFSGEFQKRRADVATPELFLAAAILAGYGLQFAPAAQASTVTIL